MEKLYSAEDLQARYGCSLYTAQKYLRQMKHLKIRPPKAYESAVMQWEAENMAPAAGEAVREKAKKRKPRKPILGIAPVPPKPGQYISRERPKNLKAAE